MALDLEPEFKVDHSAVLNNPEALLSVVVRGLRNPFRHGVRTVIELREAGAFGTGGFGGDRPSAETCSLTTLAQIRQTRNAGLHLRDGRLSNGAARDRPARQAQLGA